MTTETKHEIRKIAKKKFNIPKSAWINVFQISNKEYRISYLIDRNDYIEREETLILE
jgi:hypothetical protein